MPLQKRSVMCSTSILGAPDDQWFPPQHSAGALGSSVRSESPILCIDSERLLCRTSILGAPRDQWFPAQHSARAAALLGGADHCEFEEDSTQLHAFCVRRDLSAAAAVPVARWAAAAVARSKL